MAGHNESPAFGKATMTARDLVGTKSVIHRSDSTGLGWQAVSVAHQLEAPFEAALAAIDDTLIVLHLDGPTTVLRRLHDMPERRPVPPGAMVVIPGGNACEIRLEQHAETIHVMLQRAVLQQAANDLLIADDTTTAFVASWFSVFDATAAMFVKAIRSAAEQRAGAMYADGMARALALHLVHISRSSRTSEALVGGVLSSRDQARLVDYVEAHLDEKLTTNGIANAINRNPAWLSRAFRNAFGVPLYRYILNRRISRSCDMLTGSTASLAQIALACGFCNQEHMTRHFRSQQKTTPGAYRAAFCN
jgi:AraC family transcriptional regulator